MFSIGDILYYRGCGRIGGIIFYEIFRFLREIKRVGLTKELMKG
jgi:hypothetical protein